MVKDTGVTQNCSTQWSLAIVINCNVSCDIYTGINNTQWFNRMYVYVRLHTCNLFDETRLETVTTRQAGYPQSYFTGTKIEGASVEQRQKE